MRSCFGFLIFAFGLVAAFAGADAQENKEQSPWQIYEMEVLERPCFEKPFYDLLLETLDNTGWETLDSRWAAQEKTDPRFTVLRGMLAERQGRFEKALGHYEAAHTSDWGAYHRARFLAFLGRTQDAKRELAAVVSKSQHPWLFHQAAAGLGEIILIEQGPEAAENYYSDLWENHAGLPARMALMEPLLSLRMAAGKGVAWLNKLKPASDAPAANASEAEIDQGVLWSWGKMLSSPRPASSYHTTYLMRSNAHLYGSTMVSEWPAWLLNAVDREDTGRWFPTFLQVSGSRLRSLGKVVQDLPKAPHDAYVVITVLRFAARRGPEHLRQTLTALTPVLQEKPWLLNSLFAYQKSDVLEARGALQELLSKSKHPTGQFMLLLLRAESGEKPEALSSAAQALWDNTHPDQILEPAFTSFPNRWWELSNGYLKEGIGGSVIKHDGLFEPRWHVIWNLRGKEFLEVMQARFDLQLQAAYSGAYDWPSLVPQMRKDGTWDWGNLAQINRGADLRQCLWSLRKPLGLRLDPEPGKLGQTAADHLTDAMIRGQFSEITASVKQEKDLSQVPAKWLLVCLRTLDQQLSNLKNAQPDGHAREESEEQAAEGRIHEALQSQRSEWISNVLAGHVGWKGKPLLKREQIRELLLTHSLEVFGGPVVKHQRLENWKAVLPSVQDQKSLDAEHEKARHELALSALPHPLWGLQWQPSLRRQQCLVMTDFAPIVSQERYLTESLPKMVNATQDNAWMAARPPVSDQVTPKLLRCYGAALVQNQKERWEELEDYAVRYPLVHDLLAIWQMLPQTSLFHSFFGVSPGRPGIFSPRQQVDLLDILEKSKAPDAQFTLALLHHQQGDPSVTQAILEKFEGQWGALQLLHSFIENRPEAQSRCVERPTYRPVSPTAGASQASPQQLVEAALAARSLESHLHNNVTPAEMREMWGWLLIQDHDAPNFAEKSGLMVALAEHLPLKAELKARAKAEAKALDLRSNPIEARRWLENGRSRSNKGDSLVGERPAIAVTEAFLEALKKADFSIHAEFFSSIRPTGEGWIGQAVKAGMAKQMVDELAASLLRTAPEKAQISTAKLLGEFFASQPVAEYPVWLLKVTDAMVKQQRHLLTGCHQSLQQLLARLIQEKKPEAATHVARALLQALRVEDAQAGTPGAAKEANQILARAWSPSGKLFYIEAHSPMQAAIKTALQGDDASAFAKSLVEDAKNHPQDEQLLSCTAVAAGLTNQPIAEAAKFVEKLEPKEQARVAWRICELTDPKSAQLAELAPIMARGLELQLNEDKDNSNEEGLALQCARAILPWLAKAGATEDIRKLTASIAPRLRSAAFNSEQWFEWLRLAHLQKDKQLLDATMEGWRRQIDQRLAKQSENNQSWDYDIPNQLCMASAVLDGDAGHAAVLMADQVWDHFFRNYSGREDPHSGYLRAQADQLTSYGETERLAARLADCELVARLGGPSDYQQLLERMRQQLDLLRDPEHLAQPVLRLESTGADETRGRLHWQLCLNLDVYGEMTERIAWKRPGSAFHLKILAGTTPGSMRAVGGASEIGPVGSVEIQCLPPSGYVQGLVSNLASDHVNIGSTEPYSLRKPLLSIGSESPEKDLKWEPEWAQAYGTPVTPAAAVDSGMSFFLDLAEDGGKADNFREQNYRYNIIALDADLKPLGGWPVMARYDPWAYMNNRRGSPVIRLSNPFQLQHERIQDAGRVRHIVVTMADRGDRGTKLRQAWLRPFSQSAPMPDLTIPELEAVKLASVGFAINSWQMCENHPRAVFQGEDNLVVYDTEETPWKELLRMKDRALAQGGWVCMLSPDVACFCQNQAPPDRQPKIWQLRWEGPGGAAKSLSECKVTTIPVSATYTEMCAEEDGVVFLAQPNERTLEVNWMDNAFQTTKLTIKREGGAETFPSIAWWPAGGKEVVIQDGTAQHHILKTAEGLREIKTTQGKMEAGSVPQGAIPGQRITPAKWLIKNEQVLMEVDLKTGRPRQAFKLPSETLGNPLWWGRRHESVLYQTPDQDLMMVEPRKAADKKR